MSTRLLALVLAGCMQRESASALGGERDPCRAGSACDPGLTCLSDRCVRMPEAPAPPRLDAGATANLPLGLPPDCVAYVTALDRYAACPKLPADARRAMADVIVQLKHNWAGLGSAAMPPEVADACRQGTAAIQQGMTSFGC